MVNVVTEVIIERPVNEVAEYVANPDNAPSWYKNIKSVKWESPHPLKLGSKITFVAHFLGKVLEYTYLVSEYRPGEKLIMQTEQGPFPMQTTYTWIGIDRGKTKMVLRNTGSPSGFSKLISPFVSLMMRRANNHDLKKLKMILEH